MFDATIRLTMNLLMPIRWYGTSDRNDPTYKHFSRVVNLTLHAMAFAAVNSGLWFVQQIRHPWENLNLFTETWLLVLSIHFVSVLVMRPKGTETETTETMETTENHGKPWTPREAITFYYISHVASYVKI